MPVVELEFRDQIAIATVDNPPVNALGRSVRAGLLDAVAAAQANGALRALIIRSRGRAFIAGADIRELDSGLAAPHTPELVARIEALDRPVIAAIEGSALGGGLEVALACHYRIAAQSAAVGFPEVRLGLIPGASGTQRLPRLVGVAAALDIMLEGRPVDARKALAIGMLDRIVESGDLLDAAIGYAKELLERGQPLRRLRDVAAPAVEPGLFDEYRRRWRAKARGLEAPERILRSVEQGLSLPFDDAVARERELFLECLESAQSRAMRYAFLAEREAVKPPGLRRDAAARLTERVAIIGAGTMGTGIALACLGAGLPVALNDLSGERLDRGRVAIDEALRMDAAKGRITQTAVAEISARLETSTDLKVAARADLVIEAVFEDMALKRELFERLDEVCAPGARLASNTSTLDIDRIAAATRRPADVLGLHFFSPAQVMRLIEVVRGRSTSDETLLSALAFAKRLGKLGITVGNGFAFVGNRMYYAYGRESQLLLLEGAAPETIDRALRDWGMTMGPHAVGDLAGLDVGYRSRRQRADATDDPRHYRIANMLAEMGRYGQKTGRGMYLYAPGSRVPLPDPELRALIVREARVLGIGQRRIDDVEIVERCIYALILEGARVLEEGLASRTGDIDAIWVNGYGFPRHRGGPMRHADDVGLGKVLETVQDFAARFGPKYWEPPRLLVDLARRGQTFADFRCDWR